MSDHQSVLFGRSRGFEESRKKIIVANYQAGRLTREGATMNLRAHGVSDEEILTMLGTQNTELNGNQIGDDAVVINPPKNPPEINDGRKDDQQWVKRRQRTQGFE